MDTQVNLQCVHFPPRPAVSAWMPLSQRTAHNPLFPNSGRFRRPEAIQTQHSNGACYIIDASGLAHALVRSHSVWYTFIDLYCTHPLLPNIANKGTCGAIPHASVVLILPIPRLATWLVTNSNRIVTECTSGTASGRLGDRLLIRMCSHRTRPVEPGHALHFVAVPADT